MKRLALGLLVAVVGVAVALWALTPDVPSLDAAELAELQRERDEQERVDASPPTVMDPGAQKRYAESLRRDLATQDAKSKLREP